MTDERRDPFEEPAYRYRPSGRVNLPRFAPMLAAGVIVSAVMAFLLAVAGSWFYLYLITPLVLGLPVFGMTWAAVRLGRCRNPGVGGFAGVVLAFVYYAGFWELSYLANVVSQGPVMVAIVEQVGGLPGLPGYVVFRCKTSQPKKLGQAAGNANRPPGTIDLLFNGLLFGAETLLVAGIATGIGRSTASRVYSERLRRWSSSADYLLPAPAAEDAAAAILAGDWATVASIPRVPPGAAAQAPVANLRIEHFPDEPDEPAYVTLRAGRRSPAEWIRREVPVEQMDDLARAFRELRPTTTVEAAPPPPSATALEESLGRLGLASDPTSAIAEPGRRPRGKADFRDPAVAAGLAILGDRPVPPLATADASLCLPASEDGPRQLRHASWAYIGWMAIPLVGMFGSLGGGLGLATIAKGGGPDTPLSNAFLAAGMIGFFAAAIVGLVYGSRGLRSWRDYLIRRVGGRPGTPIGMPDEPPSAALALENGETFHKMKLLGDDFAIVFFDRERRRLVIEGLTHRYVIRAEDVSQVWPVAASAAAAVRVDWRAGDEPLSLVFSEMNIWNQIPLGAGKARRVAEEHFRRFAEALDATPSTP